MSDDFSHRHPDLGDPHFVYKQQLLAWRLTSMFLLLLCLAVSKEAESKRSDLQKDLNATSDCL